MKIKMLTLVADVYHLHKRAIIKIIFDQHKNICQAEHSWQRSQANYFNNIFTDFIAYNSKDKKPCLKDNFMDA